jgi:hypothetical protein
MHAVGQVMIEVVTVTGRAAAVEVRLRPDGVEIWHHRTLAATFDRARFGHWLDDPAMPLERAGVSFSLDRMVDVRGRVAISLPDVLAWALSPTELAALELRIRRPAC